MKTYRGLLSVVSLALLAACGGGGGSGGSSEPAPQQPSAPPPTPTTITASNADLVAGNASNAVDAITAGAGTSASWFVLDAGQPAQKAGAGATAWILREHQRWHDGSRPAPTEVHAQAASSQQLACSGGGSMVVSASYASQTSDTVGDYFSVSFSNCVESGETMNGGMSMTITSVSNSSLGYSAGFTNLRSSSGSSSLSLNGQMSVTVTFGTNTLTIASSTASFTASEVYNGKTSSITLSSATSSASLNNSTLAGTYSVNETFTTTNSNGTVIRATISTLSPITDNASGVITGGKIRVTGNGSRLDITFLGSDLVRLDIDTNADGVVDSSKTVQLSALRAL